MSRMFVTLYNILKGDWGSWNAWSAWSSTCGEAERERLRSCKNQDLLCDDRFCAGSNRQNERQAKPCCEFGSLFFIPYSKSQAIPRMDPGRVGTSGVVAVSRAAQDKQLAGALVNFFLIVMEDPVRVL